jgi:tetratricopeptide (TPR) repeat protein
LGLAYAVTGQHEKAIAVLEEAVSQNSDVMNLGYLAWAYALSGEADRARELLEELNERSRKGYVPFARRAFIQAALRETDLAFELLEKSFQQHEPYLVWLNVHPLSDYLRSDPRFAALIRRMNLEP